MEPSVVGGLADDLGDGSIFRSETLAFLRFDFHEPVSVHPRIAFEGAGSGADWHNLRKASCILFALELPVRSDLDAPRRFQLARMREIGNEVAQVLLKMGSNLQNR